MLGNSHATHTRTKVLAVRDGTLELHTSRRGHTKTWAPRSRLKTIAPRILTTREILAAGSMRHIVI